MPKVSKFEQAADGKWTIATWIEIVNDASGTAVAGFLKCKVALLTI